MTNVIFEILGETLKARSLRKPAKKIVKVSTGIFITLHIRKGNSMSKQKIDSEDVSPFEGSINNLF